MKNTLLLFFLITNCIIAQNDDDNIIQKLMLKMKYPQVVNILEEKSSNGEEITYDEQFILAVAYQRMLNYHKAEQILVSLGIKRSNDVTVLFALAQNFRAQGNNRAAMGVYKEVLEKENTNIAARVELANLKIEMKSFNSAKKLYKQLLLIDSTNFYYHRQLGFALHKIGENEEAQVELRKAIEINHYDSKSALWMAKIHYDRNEFEKAFMIIKKSMEYNPNDLQLNKLGAGVLFKMKKYNSAAVQYQNLIMLGDSSAVIYQKLGLSLYSSIDENDNFDKEENNEKLAAAIQAFKNSIKLEDTDNSLTLTYLGFCFEALKQYEQAIFYFEKAINSMTPEYIDKVYSNLGAVYENENKYPKAIKAYLKSLKYSNKNPSIVFRLAALYDRYYADKTVALANYKKYLRLVGKAEDTSTEYAKKRIVKLREEIHFHGN